MSTKEIEIDIDLNDVLDYIDSLKGRVDGENRIRAILNKISGIPQQRKLSLEDILIDEHLQKASKKYSLSEIEKRLPL